MAKPSGTHDDMLAGVGPGVEEPAESSRSVTCDDLVNLLGL